MSQKGFVSDYFGLAASRLAFLVKLTAFKKGFILIRSKAIDKPVTTSSNVPSLNSFVSDVSPLINHDKASAYASQSSAASNMSFNVPSSLNSISLIHEIAPAKHLIVGDLTGYALLFT